MINKDGRRHWGEGLGHYTGEGQNTRTRGNNKKKWHLKRPRDRERCVVPLFLLTLNSMWHRWRAPQLLPPFILKSSWLPVSFPLTPRADWPLGIAVQPTASWSKNRSYASFSGDGGVCECQNATLYKYSVLILAFISEIQSDWSMWLHIVFLFFFFTCNWVPLQERR